MQEYSIETPKSPADLADCADKQQNLKTTLIPTCLSLRDNAACCIPLRHLRNLRENNTQEDSIYLHRRNPNISPADLADLRRQNHKTALTSPPHQPVFLCEIMQPRCIRLRHLRDLRENIHMRVLNLLAQMKRPILPLIPLIYADKTPKQQNSNNCNSLKQPVFLCDIMQLCCIPLRDLRNLRENNTQEDSIY